jgi:hypothetical protein
VRDLRASRLLPGVDAIRLPGDRRAACRAERLRDGVPIPKPLLAQLDTLAAELFLDCFAELVIGPAGPDPRLAMMRPNAQSSRYQQKSTP